MRRVATFFIGGLWVVGLLVGVIVAVRPGLLPIPVPHVIVPLIVGLIVDIALRPLIHAGRIAPVTMNERAIGVIGAGVISLATSALLMRDQAS